VASEENPRTNKEIRIVFSNLITIVNFVEKYQIYEKTKDISVLDITRPHYCIDRTGMPFPGYQNGPGPC